MDLDPKFLSESGQSNVEIVRADIRTAQLPEQSFDLVHARYVLIHIPDYEAALNRMLDCLEPGGWLVLEEPDFSESHGITGSEGQLKAVQKVNDAIKCMYERLGMDYALGRNVPGLLQSRGLQSMTMENDGPPSACGSVMATIMKMSAVQLREKYLATGVVSDEDLEQYCRFAENPQSSAVYYATIGVSGRKAS